MQGHIVVITRNGSLGGRYPLTSKTCLFGKSPNCDVRVYVDNVAMKHCLITALPNERAHIRNLSPSNATMVNGIPLRETQYELQHADVITVGDRHFRWEYHSTSRQKTAAKKTVESDNHRSPTCMVQVPMSVLKKKRHSSPGVVRENEIISITSQNGDEHNVKRRKTLHSVTDLVKPVNKKLSAVTQPMNSPKSLNTFKFLLNSVNRRKSLHSHTKSQKKIISSKVRKSQSHSPQKDLQKQISQPKYSRKSISTEALSKSSPVLQKSNSKRKTIAIMSLKNKTPIQNKRSSLSPKNRKISSESKLLVKKPRGRPKGSLTSSARKLQLHESPSSKKLSILNMSNNNASPIRKQGGPKTPKISSLRKSVLTPKSLLDLVITSKTKTPKKTPGRPKISDPKTPHSVSSKVTHSKDMTPKSPRGRPSKTPKASHKRKSVSPNQSFSIDMTPEESTVSKRKLSFMGKSVSKANVSVSSELSVSPAAKPRGRPSKAAVASPRLSLQQSVSPTKATPSSSPVKTPGRRGRPPKTPQSSSTKHSLLNESDVSQNQSMLDKSPSKTPRGKLSQSPVTSPARKSLTPAVSPSTTSRSNSPVKTPGRRGRPPKTPQSTSVIHQDESRVSQDSPMIDTSSRNTPRGELSQYTLSSPAIKSLTPFVSSSRTSRSSSPVKTPGRRGRPPKTPQSTSVIKQQDGSRVSQESSMIDTSYRSTPSGELSQYPLTSTARKSLTSVVSPSRASRSNSPVKTPGRRGRSPKTPQSSSTKHSLLNDSEDFEYQSMFDQTTNRTPRGKLSQSPVTSTRISSTPVVSPSRTSRSNSLVKTPGRRGRPPKTPQSTSVIHQDESRVSQDSSMIDTSSRNIPRGELSQSSVTSPVRKSLTPAVSPSRTSRSNSPVKTPGRRGRPPKTPQSTSVIHQDESRVSQDSSMIDTSSRNIPRGELSQSSVTSPVRKSLTPAVSPSRTSRSNSTVKTPGGRGRPPKTPQSTSVIHQDESRVSQDSFMIDTSSRNTPRGKLSQSHVSSARKSLTPVVSPTRTSRSNSPVKTPGRRGKSPKTPQSTSVIHQDESRVSQDSSVIDTSTRSTPSVELSQSHVSSARKSLTPVVSPARTSRSNSPVKTPGRRGRPPKTPQSTSVIHQDESRASPDSSMIDTSSRNTPRGKLSQSPVISARKSHTPVVSPSRTSRSSSIVKAIPCNTPKDRSSFASPKSSGSSNKVQVGQSFTPTVDNTSKGKTPKTPVISPTTMSTPKSSKKEKSLERDISSTLLDQSNVSAVSGTTKSARRSALKSGLSSSKKASTSLNKPLLMNSSMKKAEIAKLQMDSKRKYDTEAEAKAERAAKRLKMETPKSLTKNKKAALLVCHSPKSLKRPLFSEVLKSHLSTVKKNLATAPHPIVAKRSVKQIYKPPISLEVPKSFKFNSTGHANSPETIVIRKRMKSTPIPKMQKTRRGRKSTLYAETKTIEDQNLEGVSELYKTPKAIVSSLKSASSVKKPQSARVRFSLQNDVQSPSGRKSSVMHRDEVIHFGSPMVPSKKFIGTPMPKRNKLSDISLIHTSIMEESLLAHEMDTSGSKTSSSKASNNAFDFSAYSPSSPTLQFSRISGISSDLARRSIDFAESPSSERKTSLRTPNDKKSSISKQFSVDSPKLRNSPAFQPSPDNRAIFTQSDLIDSSSMSSDSLRSTRSSNNSKTKAASEKNSPNVTFGPGDNIVILTRFPKRISSTPKGKDDSQDSFSPITSPISVFDKTSSVGKKTRKSSNRMNASNAQLLTPDSQVPVAAVKPSTRRKQGNESFSSVAESVTLSAFSVSNAMSERSVNRSLARKIMDSRASSGLDQPSTSTSSTPSIFEDISLGSLNSSRRKRKSSGSTSLQSVDATTFDFASTATPKIPREMFVSPLGKVSDDLTDVSGVKQIFNSKGRSPVSSYEDVKGLKEMFKSSEPLNNLTDVLGVKRVMSPNANSPMSSYIDVRGVKRLLKTPKPQSPLANYSSIEGIKELFKHSPIADYINVKGVRRIFKQAKVPNSPDIAGVEVLFESPKTLMEEYNQKPIGMVPPMSRDSSPQVSRDYTEVNDHDTGDNQPTSRNAASTSQKSSRRKTSALQVKTADSQSKPNTSSSLRKGRPKRLVAESQVASKAQSPTAEIVSPPTNTVKSPKNAKLESHNISNVEPDVGRRTRQTRLEKQTKTAKSKKDNNEKDSKKIKQTRGTKITESDENKEKLLPIKRKARGRETSPAEQDLIALESKPKRKLRGVQENLPSTDLDEAKKSVPSRESKINKASSTKEIAHPVSPANSEPDLKESKKRGRHKKPQPEAEMVNSQSPELKVQTTSRKRKTDSAPSSSNLTGQINIRTENENRTDLDDSFSKPSSSARQENGRTTRRRVQFNMKKSPSPEKSSPKKRGAAKSKPSASTVENNTEPPTPAKGSKGKKKETVTLKTKASPKLKASPKNSVTPPKVNSRTRSVRGRSKVKTPSPARVAKETSPLPKKETKSRTAKGATKAKTPSPKKIAKENSPSPKRGNTRRRTTKEATKTKTPSPARVARESSPLPKRGRARPAKGTTKTKTPSPTKEAMEHSPLPKRGRLAKETTKTKTPSPAKGAKESLPSPKKGRGRLAKGTTKPKTPSPTKGAKESSPSTSKGNTRARAVKGAARKVPSPAKVPKIDSPATSPVKKVAAKKVSTKVKASPKLKAAKKIASPPAKESKSTKKVPAKTVTAKTKASPKLKATAKKSISPVKRATRSRK